MKQVLAIILVVIAADPASACECIRVLTRPPAREDVLRDASVAFVGWPVAVTCVEEGGQVVAFDYVFEVAEAWLPSKKRVTVRTSFSTCGYLFESDKRYLIIGSGDAPATVTRCSNTGPAKDATETLTLLGEPLRRFRRASPPRSTVTVIPACIDSHVR